MSDLLDLNLGVKLGPDQQKQAIGYDSNLVENKMPQPGTNRSYGSQDKTLPVEGVENMGIGKNDYDLSSAAHPVACIFTFSFKLAAFLIYLLGKIFFSTIIVFILVVVLSALDFWTVKNVTGRLLVGLRWWSDYDSQGKQVWKFQSYDNEFKPNTVDSAFFWTSQLASTLVWIVFLLIKVFGLDVFWALLVFINLSLSATNLYGYYKCRGQHSKKLTDLQKKGALYLAGKFI